MTLPGQYDPSNDNQFYQAIKFMIENKNWHQFFISYPGIFPRDLPKDVVPISKRALRMLVDRINELEEELEENERWFELNA